MTTRFPSRFHWLRSALATGATLTTASGLAFGCSSSSTTITTTPPADSGADTSTGKADTGTKDTGTPDTSTGTPDAGSDAPTVSLYTTLGGHAGIRAAVNSIVAAELLNADIASYFFYQTTASAPADGHPSVGQIEECFTDLVGKAAGGPEVYPATLAADAGGPYTCRPLPQAHRDLQIDTGTFNTFVTIAAGVLAAPPDAGGFGLGGADLAALGSALLSTESAIVTAGDGGLTAFPEAGIDAALHLDATY